MVPAIYNQPSLQLYGGTGQTSIENMYHSVSIIRNVIDAMSPLRSDSIIIVVSNPVDLLASLAAELSRLPTDQVLGSGTFLDSIRLRGLVADKLNVPFLCSEPPRKPNGFHEVEVLAD